MCDLTVGRDARRRRTVRSRHTHLSTCILTVYHRLSTGLSGRTGLAGTVCRGRGHTGTGATRRTRTTTRLCARGPVGHFVEHRRTVATGVEGAHTGRRRWQVGVVRLTRKVAAPVTEPLHARAACVGRDGSRLFRRHTLSRHTRIHCAGAIRAAIAILCTTADAIDARLIGRTHNPAAAAIRIVGLDIR